MTYLQWQDRLDTGIGVIDEQHKRIVAYINSLYDVSHQTSPRTEELKQIINELMVYTLSHFAFEESLIEQAKFKDFDKHKEKHDKFSDLIHSFQRKFKNGEEITEDLLTLLNNWLFGHILHEDAQYIEIVKEHFNIKNTPSK